MMAGGDCGRAPGAVFALEGRSASLRLRPETELAP
jgi:hypothetical protein